MWSRSAQLVVIAPRKIVKVTAALASSSIFSLGLQWLESGFPRKTKAFSKKKKISQSDYQFYSLISKPGNRGGLRWRETSPAPRHDTGEALYVV